MKECSFQVLVFACEHPEDFNRIVCQKSEEPSKLLCLYRICQGLYEIAITIWIICGIVMSPEQKFYISYNTWVQVFWCIVSECAVMTSLRTFMKFDPESLEVRLPWYTKVYWAVFSAILPAVVVSFIVFWVEVFHDDVDLLYIFLGNVTPFLTLVEFALVAFPLRILHFFYFILHSVLYLIISVIYYKAGGKGMYGNPYIYKHLDWRNPKHAVLAFFISLFVGEAAFVIFWGFSVLKLSKYCCRKETE